MRDALFDCSGSDAEIDAALQEAEVVSERIRRCVDENSSIAQDQEVYSKRYDRLAKRYEAVKDRLTELQKKRTGREKKAEAINRFMQRLAERDEALTTFTDGLWLDSIDQVTVHPSGTLAFRFQDGTEILI